MHHPLQTLHHMPPSPPEFRDLNLPTSETQRPDEIDVPTSVLGAIPTGMGVTYEVPSRLQSNGMGRRLPIRMEGLNILASRIAQRPEGQ